MLDADVHAIQKGQVFYDLTLFPLHTWTKTVTLPADLLSLIWPHHFHPRLIAAAIFEDHTVSGRLRFHT
jgi:hypothetical protein